MAYVEIGPTPVYEGCCQIGRDPSELNVIECRIYAEMLRRLHPEAPCEFRIKSFPHDFGTYREVCVFYDEDDDEQARFAYDIEGDCPENWDDQALAELNSQLAQKGYAYQDGDYVKTR